MNDNTSTLTGRHFINGQWHKGSGQSLTSLNPATHETLWQGTIASEEEVHLAFTAARAALAKWSAAPFSERAKLITRFSEVVEKHRVRLAQWIAMENGKPLWEALTEVSAVTGKAALSIKACEQRTPQILTPTATGQSCLRYKPHGVVAVLGPFNFPAHLSNGHIIPALLAGNTVVLKPSELTPAVSEILMQCWQEAGLPAGVLNCVQGDASTGQALLAQDIQAVYFTGSYQTGKRIHQFYSERPDILLALEMGGNNPLIVEYTNALDAAVYNALQSAFITSGQRCTCARRLYVPDSAFGDAFLKRFIAAAEKIQPRAWNAEPEPFIGPVISPQHAIQHIKAQQRLLDNGGAPLLAMKQLQDDSAFLSPGIIDISLAQTTSDEEIFAPLVQVTRYKHFDDALAMANRTQYGLSAGLLCDDDALYQRFFQAIRAGLVNWNKPTTGAASNLPFGGVGLSGNHRPSAFFAADYCAYPIASQEDFTLTLPPNLLPGITLDV